MDLSTEPFPDHAAQQGCQELEAISRVLDDNPAIYELVYRDMVRAKRADTGREGMTAEQVLLTNACRANVQIEAFM